MVSVSQFKEMKREKEICGKEELNGFIKVGGREVFRINLGKGVKT